MEYGAVWSMEQVLRLLLSIFPLFLAQTQARDYSTQAGDCRAAVSALLLRGGHPQGYRGEWPDFAFRSIS